MSQGQVIDIMTFNSYSLQYYSFRKGKIGFARTVPVSWTTPIHTRRYSLLFLKTDVFWGCASARNLWRKSLMKYGLWPEINHRIIGIYTEI